MFYTAGISLQYSTTYKDSLENIMYSKLLSYLCIFRRLLDYSLDLRWIDVQVTSRRRTKVQANKETSMDNKFGMSNFGYVIIYYLSRLFGMDLML